MMPAVRRLAPFLVAAALATPAAGWGATLYVNFEHGQDAASGLSPAAAWKHAPGDSNAAGVPARIVLHPGDNIVFADKVRYRGSILVTASGEAGQPIVFSGEGSRQGAIIDGSDPALRIQPCRGADECGGAADWQKLVRVALPAALDDDDALFSAAGPMRPAQEPDPKSDFYRDEIDDMLEVDPIAMSQGKVALPHALATGLRGHAGRLALWVQPNRVVYRPILNLDGDIARFDPSGLKFYTDRNARAAVIDHVSLIDQPGEYAVLPGGAEAIAMIPAGSAVTIASGRAGFVLRGASHIAIKGLGFENMADGGGGPPAGIAVFTQRPGSQDITIEANRFRNFVMPHGQGPIILRDVDGVRITGNIIDGIALGSGMRLTGSHILIADNQIQRIGRTGIMLMNASDATVRGNSITDVQGVHGNGMSAYLDNHDIRFVANTVTGARQPATFHGAGAGGTDNNILFANNLFVATPDALGALISWGKSTRGVTIRNNILVGGKTGLRLSSTDTSVTITDNIVNGMVIAGNQPGDWRVAGNEWTALSFQQRRDASKPAISAKAVAAAKRAEKGQVSDDLCAVIVRNSLPTKAIPAEAARAAGAAMRCP